MNMFTATNQNNNVMPVAFFIKEQENILSTLYSLLEQERVALRHRDIESITKYAQQKSQLMVKLQANDQKIRLHSEASLLKTLFKERVATIKAKLQECKRLNAINGRLINLALNSTVRLSAVLMQTRDRVTRNLTYNDRGRTTARGPMRLSIEC